jgi:hypothetical protein
MPKSSPESIREASLAESIIRHWEINISAALLEREPFEHFYIEEIWPQNVYLELLNSLPPIEHYVPINIKKWVRANGESTRDRIALTEQNIGKLESRLQEFWLQITKALYSDELKIAVFSKLKRDISLRLGIKPEEVPYAKVLAGADLIRDTEEYRIKPHPDGYPRAVTMQFYLPENADQLDLGTSLYVKDSMLRRLFGKRFQEVKRMSFKPNSGYAFAVNDRPDRCSLHGRELIKGEAGVRNSLLLSWYIEAPNKGKSSAAQVVPTRSVIG